MPRHHPLRPALVTLFAALSLLAGGCAPLEWHHDGHGKHKVDRDQALCTAQAQLEARQRMPLQAPPAPQVIVDQQGRSIVVQNRQPDSERFFLEQSLLRQCMTERGYTLQPKSQPTE
jgi:hypothetical protein